MLKNLLLLTGFSTFVVIVIIVLDVYLKNSVSSLPPNTQRRVVAIPADFDKKTLELLKQRNQITVSPEGKSRVVSEDSKDTTTTSTTTDLAETETGSESAIIEPIEEPEL